MIERTRILSALNSGRRDSAPDSETPLPSHEAQEALKKQNKLNEELFTQNKKLSSHLTNLQNQLKFSLPKFLTGLEILRLHKEVENLRKCSNGSEEQLLNLKIKNKALSKANEALSHDIELMKEERVALKKKIGKLGSTPNEFMDKELELKEEQIKKLRRRMQNLQSSIKTKMVYEEEQRARVMAERLEEEGQVYGRLLKAFWGVLEGFEEDLAFFGKLLMSCYKNVAVCFQKAALVEREDEVVSQIGFLKKLAEKFVDGFRVFKAQKKGLVGSKGLVGGSDEPRGGIVGQSAEKMAKIESFEKVAKMAKIGFFGGREQRRVFKANQIKFLCGGLENLIKLFNEKCKSEALISFQKKELERRCSTLGNSSGHNHSLETSPINPRTPTHGSSPYKTSKIEKKGFNSTSGNIAIWNANNHIGPITGEHFIHENQESSARRSLEDWNAQNGTLDGAVVSTSPDHPGEYTLASAAENEVPGGARKVNRPPLSPCLTPSKSSASLQKMLIDGHQRSEEEMSVKKERLSMQRRASRGGEGDFSAKKQKFFDGDSSSEIRFKVSEDGMESVYGLREERDSAGEGLSGDFYEKNRRIRKNFEKENEKNLRSFGRERSQNSQQTQTEDISPPRRAPEMPGNHQNHRFSSEKKNYGFDSSGPKNGYRNSNSMARAPIGVVGVPRMSQNHENSTQHGSYFNSGFGANLNQLDPTRHHSGQKMHPEAPIHPQNGLPMPQNHENRSTTKKGFERRKSKWGQRKPQSRNPPPEGAFNTPNKRDLVGNQAFRGKKINLINRPDSDDKSPSRLDVDYLCGLDSENQPPSELNANQRAGFLQKFEKSQKNEKLTKTGKALIFRQQSLPHGAQNMKNYYAELNSGQNPWQNQQKHPNWQNPPDYPNPSKNGRKPTNQQQHNQMHHPHRPVSPNYPQNQHKSQKSQKSQSYQSKADHSSKATRNAINCDLHTTLDPSTQNHTLKQASSNQSPGKLNLADSGLQQGMLLQQMISSTTNLAKNARATPTSKSSIFTEAAKSQILGEIKRKIVDSRGGSQTNTPIKRRIVASSQHRSSKKLENLGLSGNKGGAGLEPNLDDLGAGGRYRGGFEGGRDAEGTFRMADYRSKDNIASRLNLLERDDFEGDYDVLGLKQGAFERLGGQKMAQTRSKVNIMVEKVNTESGFSGLPGPLNQIPQSSLGTMESNYLTISNIPAQTSQNQTNSAQNSEQPKCRIQGLQAPHRLPGGQNQTHLVRNVRMQLSNGKREAFSAMFSGADSNQKTAKIQLIRVRDDSREVSRHRENSREPHRPPQNHKKGYKDNTQNMEKSLNLSRQSSASYLQKPQKLPRYQPGSSSMAQISQNESLLQKTGKVEKGRNPYRTKVRTPTTPLRTKPSQYGKVAANSGSGLAKNGKNGNFSEFGNLINSRLKRDNKRSSELLGHALNPSRQVEYLQDGRTRVITKIEKFDKNSKIGQNRGHLTAQHMPSTSSRTPYPSMREEPVIPAIPLMKNLKNPKFKDLGSEVSFNATLALNSSNGPGITPSTAMRDSGARGRRTSVGRRRKPSLLNPHAWKLKERPKMAARR